MDLGQQEYSGVLKRRDMDASASFAAFRHRKHLKLLKALTLLPKTPSYQPSMRKKWPL
jgi:hypothetical protein